MKLHLTPSIGAETAGDALAIIKALLELKQNNLSIAASAAVSEGKAAEAQGEAQANTINQQAEAQYLQGAGQVAGGLVGIGTVGIGMKTNSSIGDDLNAVNTKLENVTANDETVSKIQKENLQREVYVEAKNTDGTVVEMPAQKALKEARETVKAIKPEAGPLSKTQINALKTVDQPSFDAYQERVSTVRKDLQKQQAAFTQQKSANIQQFSAIATSLTSIMSGSFAIASGVATAASAAYAKEQIIEQYVVSTWTSVLQAMNSMADGAGGMILGVADTMMGIVAATNRV